MTWTSWTQAIDEIVKIKTLLRSNDKSSLAATNAAITIKALAKQCATFAPNLTIEMLFQDDGQDNFTNLNKLLTELPDVINTLYSIKHDPHNPKNPPQALASWLYFKLEAWTKSPSIAPQVLVKRIQASGELTGARQQLLSIIEKFAQSIIPKGKAPISRPSSSAAQTTTGVEAQIISSHIQSIPEAATSLNTATSQAQNEHATSAATEYAVLITSAMQTFTKTNSDIASKYISANTALQRYTMLLGEFNDLKERIKKSGFTPGNNVELTTLIECVEERITYYAGIIQATVLSCLASNDGSLMQTLNSDGPTTTNSTTAYSLTANALNSNGALALLAAHHSSPLNNNLTAAWTQVINAFCAASREKTILSLKIQNAADALAGEKQLDPQTREGFAKRPKNLTDELSELCKKPDPMLAIKKHINQTEPKIAELFSNATLLSQVLHIPAILEFMSEKIMREIDQNSQLPFLMISSVLTSELAGKYKTQRDRFLSVIFKILGNNVLSVKKNILAATTPWGTFLIEHFMSAEKIDSVVCFFELLFSHIIQPLSYIVHPFSRGENLVLIFINRLCAIFNHKDPKYTSLDTARKIYQLYILKLGEIFNATKYHKIADSILELSATYLQTYADPVVAISILSSDNRDIFNRIFSFLPDNDLNTLLSRINQAISTDKTSLAKMIRHVVLLDDNDNKLNFMTMLMTIINGATREERSVLIKDIATHDMAVLQYVILHLPLSIVNDFFNDIYSQEIMPMRASQPTIFIKIIDSLVACEMQRIAKNLVFYSADIQKWLMLFLTHFRIFKTDVMTLTAEEATSPDSSALVLNARKLKTVIVACIQEIWRKIVLLEKMQESFEALTTGKNLSTLNQAVLETPDLFESLESRIPEEKSAADAQLLATMLHNALQLEDSEGKNNLIQGLLIRWRSRGQIQSFTAEVNLHLVNNEWIIMLLNHLWKHLLDDFEYIEEFSSFMVDILDDNIPSLMGRQPEKALRIIDALLPIFVLLVCKIEKEVSIDMANSLFQPLAESLKELIKGIKTSHIGRNKIFTQSILEQLHEKIVALIQKNRGNDYMGSESARYNDNYQDIAGMLGYGTIYSGDDSFYQYIPPTPPPPVKRPQQRVQAASSSVNAGDILSYYQAPLQKNELPPLNESTYYLISAAKYKTNNTFFYQMRLEKVEQPTLKSSTNYIIDDATLNWDPQSNKPTQNVIVKAQKRRENQMEIEYTEPDGINTLQSYLEFTKNRNSDDGIIDEPELQENKGESWRLRVEIT